MEQQQQSRWRPTRRQLRWAGGIAAGVAALAFLIIVICGYLFGWKWTGLPKKTLWDWLQLLIIPAVLAGVGLWFNRQQREQELQTADRRAQDEALQAYLDQMSAMLIPNKDQPSLYDEHPPDSLRTVARARTLTVLQRLDGQRKARVVQFLYEAGLIAKDAPVLDLGGAALIEADLSVANLQRADLCEALLIKADLNRANLCEADLHSAVLRDALLNTYLRGANLRGADLRRAVLKEARPNSYPNAAVLSRETDLSWTRVVTDLRSADVRDAALTEADLNGATGITNEELAQQAKSLEGATMPDGQKYEDWLKDKEGHK